MECNVDCYDSPTTKRRQLSFIHQKNWRRHQKADKPLVTAPEPDVSSAGISYGTNEIQERFQQLLRDINSQ
jgi:hypothetical protein